MVRSRRVVLRSGSTAALVAVVVLAGAIAAGQEIPPQGPPSTWTAQADVGRRTLTVEVLVSAPDKEAKTQPVANAIVRLEGADDSRDTNPQGRARFTGISSDKVSVQIMAVGADLCRLPDIPVAVGDQIVKVLVDPSSKKEKCRRLE